jgi:hypothetical protein
MTAVASLARIGIVEDPHAGEDAVDQSDIDDLMGQMRELAAAVTRIGNAQQSLLTLNQENRVHLWGLPGSPGALGRLEALEAKQSALGRELEATRGESIRLLELGLQQQNQLGESLRAAIRGVEDNLHLVRDSVDARNRDLVEEISNRVATATMGATNAAERANTATNQRIDAISKLVARSSVDRFIVLGTCVLAMAWIVYSMVAGQAR